MAERQRIRFIPVEGADDAPRCWNCGKPVAGPVEATFIYPRTTHAVVDRWRQCECGAYQNASGPHQISIESYTREEPET